MICVAIKGPTFSDARHQISLALQYADIIELRLDLFNTLDLQALEALRNEHSIPMIFTLRNLDQGGHYLHSETNRLQDIERIAQLKPEYLDIEYNVSPSFIEKIATQYPDTKLILSYHNTKSTPDNLDAIWEIMRSIRAHWYKIAVMANSPLDALRLAIWSKEHSNIIAISMGSHGQFTRIIAPFLNAPLTYACVEESKDSATAPGQLCGPLLIERYNYRKLNSQSQIYCLIGNPVDKSLSDLTHNHLFKQLDINAVYVKIALTPEELPKFLHLAKQLPIQGLSVTMPLKEHIVPLLDEVDHEASAIGAVNTLVLENGKYKGYNTDCRGALNAIESQIPVRNKKLVVIGAGGAAKSIVYEALQRGAHVTVANRTVEKAEKISKKFHCNYCSLENLSSVALTGYDIIINTTPESLPIKEKDLLYKTVAMDIKTRPQYTDFLNLAHSKQCKLVFGYQMFIEQALGQYKLWFGNILNIEECRRILLKKTQKILA
ncbi:MAG: shikimate dehydrogenase [Parachlamydiales bacterium]|jgi:3-dehydroquinate dehydratase/shikimate dehydrogenase